MLTTLARAVIAVSFTAVSEANAQGSWAVDARPLTVVGSGANDMQELSHVLGAGRLADGRIVVLNGRPMELRVFDAAGRFIRKMGRPGDGPGEFGNETELVSVGGDTVVTFTGAHRWQVFRIDGRLAGERTVDAADRPQASFYRRSFTRPAAVGMNSCARQLLEALPPPALPVLREVFADAAGRFWVRRYNSGEPWKIYSRSGGPLGTAALAPGFEVFQLGADFVLGLTHDADDVEQVVAYRVTAPVAARQSSPAGCTFRRDSSAGGIPAPRAAGFRTAIRNAETANEIYYSNSATYPAKASDIRVDVPGGARLEMLRASKQGYAMVVFDVATTFTCVVGVGAVVPPGWIDGQIHCSP